MVYIDLNQANVQLGSNSSSSAMPTNASPVQNIQTNNSQVYSKQSNSDTNANPNPNQGPLVIETTGPQFPDTLHNNVQQNVSQPVNSANLNFSNPTELGLRETSVSQQNSNQISVSSQNIEGGFKSLSPDTADLSTYFDLAEMRGASDLHFTVGYPPILRINGKLENVGVERLKPERAKQLLLSIVNDDQKSDLWREKEIDMSVAHKTGTRFRVNLYFEKGNLAGAFRLIPSKVRSITDLSLPDILYNIINYSQGLVLVTGPTGSGKSTTLAAMINEINLNRADHIVTLEDPIEYLYSAGKGLIDQREYGKDMKSWDNALRSVLRQDPDVVLVGEMRDFSTIAMTLTVAETGHLVFATLHTNSAAESIDRIIDVFPDHLRQQIRLQLSSVLVAVVSQRLIPLKSGLGRKAATEILLGTPAVKNSIREGKTHQIDNIILTSADVGMFPLEKSLAEMIRSGDITLDTAMEFTVKPDLLKKLI